MNYLTLLEAADLLAELLDLEAVTAGCIDEALDETVGVYRREGFDPRECIGAESSFQTARLRLLLRWGTNPSLAEAKAAELGGLLSALRNRPATEHTVKFADVKAIRSIGRDERGVCEYAVDADIIYSERNEA